MDTAQFIVTLLGAGGGGAVLLALANGLVKWLSGAAGRERAKNTDLATQRKEAIADRIAAEEARDNADRVRRHEEEYSATLRRQLIEAGITPAERPTILVREPHE